MVKRFRKKIPDSISQLAEPMPPIIPKSIIPKTAENKIASLILALILIVSGAYLVLESSAHRQTTASYVLKIPHSIAGINFGETKFVSVDWSTKAVNRPYSIIDDLLSKLVGETFKGDAIIKLEASSNGQVIKSTTQPIRVTSLELYHDSISIEIPFDSSCTYTLKVFDANNKLLDSVIM